MKNKYFALFILLIFALSGHARTLRILAIGNSFSRDAVEQNLYELALADGDTAIIGNLYIGGCSLERHAGNIRNNSRDYIFRKIGADGIRRETTKFTLQEAVKNDQWDIITLQQSSPLSGLAASYEPYLSEIITYIKREMPKKCKLALHQTWSYAQDSQHSGFKSYGNDQIRMYRDLTDSYFSAARKHKIKTVIPAGTAIQNARTSFVGDNMNRDGYHLDLNHGRFTAACAWYATLFNKDVTANSYIPEGMNPEIANIAKCAAQAAVKTPGTVTTLSHIAPSPDLFRNPQTPIEIRISNLLGQMTLQEKIMQLNQYTLGRNNNANNVGEEVKNIPAEIGSLIYFDIDPTLRNAMQRRAIEESRLGIPIIFGYDAIHGFRTIYPISLAQACSWNPKLVEKACGVSAREARMSGVDWTFSPMIDVARDPRWGRVAEGYGEDPYLNSIYCVASVKGYQGKSLADSTTVAACLKHYVGYGASEAGRDYVYTEISPQTLWDTYLPPYEAGVKAGAATLMSSFNDISGVPGSANRYTLTDILKQKWNHKGFVVSDWGAIEQLKNQGLAADKQSCGEKAINAGLDMDMMNHAYDRHLEELVNTGKVPMERVDDAVSRVLRVKFQLGLFENPYTPVVPNRFLRAEDLAIAESLAAQSSVLLKNDSTQSLPIIGKKRIAVIGPLASNGWDLLGNWLGHGKPEDVTTLLDGIKKEFGENTEIQYAEGCKRDGDDKSGFKKAIDAARWSDIVVLCLGENLKWSGENASRSSISLPAIQEKLAQEIAATGKPITLVLVNGRPLDLTRLEPLANSIIELWQPGVRGGEALAGILSGRTNPSGKLCITFPRGEGQIPIYYNRRKSGRPHQGFYQNISSNPLYEFGHGLSYTTFEYGELTCDKINFKSSDKVKVSVSVTNTGTRAGEETVIWYIADPYCSITRPVKEVKHFEKRLLQPGETGVFEFTIDPKRDLSFVDSSGNKFLEAGEYQIIVNGKKLKLQLTQ